MEGSASVRKSLSGTLVPSGVTAVALLQKPEEPNKGNRKVLDEEEYIEVCQLTVNLLTHTKYAAALIIYYLWQPCFMSF